MYPTNNGEFIELTESIDATLMFLQNKKDDIKLLTSEKEEMEKTIIEFIADKDGIKQGDKIIATFQANKSGNRTSTIKKRG